MYNISFMGVDEADKLAAQGLPDFITMAIKRTGGRWNEVDATVYFNKIMKEAGLPLHKDTPLEISHKIELLNEELANDLSGENSGIASPPIEPVTTGTGNSTGE